MLVQRVHHEEDRVDVALDHAAGDLDVAAVAASGPASVAPITPPAISDPATPAMVMTRCVGVMLLTSFSSEMQAWRTHISTLSSVCPGEPFNRVTAPDFLPRFDQGGARRRGPERRHAPPGSA